MRLSKEEYREAKGCLKRYNYNCIKIMNILTIYFLNIFYIMNYQIIEYYELFLFYEYSDNLII